MKKYSVTVQIKVIEEKTLYIDAENQKEAKQFAREAIEGSFYNITDWSESDYIYQNKGKIISTKKGWE